MSQNYIYATTGLCIGLVIGFALCAAIMYAISTEEEFQKKNKQSTT